MLFREELIKVFNQFQNHRQLIAFTTSNRAAETGSKKRGDKNRNNTTEFLSVPEELSDSGFGRLGAFFSVSGIDRSDKLHVFKSP